MQYNVCVPECLKTRLNVATPLLFVVAVVIFVPSTYMATLTFDTGLPLSVNVVINVSVSFTVGELYSAVIAHNSYVDVDVGGVVVVGVVVVVFFWLSL